MPRKRKTKAKEPTIKTRPITKDELTVTIAKHPATLNIRCVHDSSKLVVGADKTPSGTRYEFTAGEVKPVNFEDYQYLLAMQTRPLGCCGGSMEPQKFFEEV
jgi:hypothetical protein